MELKPCPFCGCKDITVQVHEGSCVLFYYVTVWCNNCEAEGPPHDWTKAGEDECRIEAIELWNKRYKEDYGEETM